MNLYEIILIALIVYFLGINGTYLALTATAIAVICRLPRADEGIDFDAPVPPVSVIVTAYNEELVILESVLSLLRSDHPEFEVIVVNDGSTDRTLEVAKDAFDLERLDTLPSVPITTESIRGVYRSRIFDNLRLVDKVNGGAGDAANAGLGLACHAHVAHVDSDCIVEPSTLRHTMTLLAKAGDEAVATGAHLRVGNGVSVERGRILEVVDPRRLVERFQTVEYLSAFMTFRVGWGQLNAMPVVSGAFGAWRRDAVIAFGGFSTELTHFDIGTTWRAHDYFRRRQEPYRITHDPDPTIWTQVPSTWTELARQRKRWQRVVYETVWVHRRMLFNPRYGVAGMVGLPNLLVYEALGPFVELSAYAFVIYLGIIGELRVELLVTFLLVSFGLTAVVRAAGLVIDASFFRRYSRRSMARLIVLALLEPVTYHLFLLPPRAFALVEFLRGRRTHDPSRRTAFLEAESG